MKEVMGYGKLFCIGNKDVLKCMSKTNVSSRMETNFAPIDTQLLSLILFINEKKC